MKRGGDRKSKVEKSTLKSTVKTFGVGRDYVMQARELLRESPKLFQQVKSGELTVGAAYETHRTTKEWQAAEMERNSLAELRAAHPDLAEQVTAFLRLPTRRLARAARDL